MSLTGALAAFTLKYTFNESADHLIEWLEKRFTDHSNALPAPWRPRTIAPGKRLASPWPAMDFMKTSRTFSAIAI